MVRYTKGLLLECDPTIKKYITKLNEESQEKFIIHDLGPTLLLINPSAKEMIQRKVDQLHDTNTYTKLEEMEKKISKGNLK
ncbi:general transcription factor iih subunit 5 [Anaeramoeba ignava]|uniref:General transcription and DNA repair factor IIH subunit TFB5 n=1 Tax=Anaeramoeba ignava TaxID=1746090 RepID=A0A9Q0LT94_ANAIG|nr:general transcription factor iih subunit 5 [Anaeramoeba ignava]